MKRVIIITALVVSGFNLYAQNTLDNILAEVEKNNTTLSAYRKSADAEKIGNKTGLTPQNPEVEFNYLWGSPSDISNRTDFAVRQSFDFPTVYSYKLQISDLKNEQAELEYKKQRNEILYQTRVVCVKLIYHNALNGELSKRRADALRVAEAYKTRYSAGDIGILEYNKVQVNLLNVTKELESNEIERNALLSELVTLNGGISINFTDKNFMLQFIPVDFEEWFTQAVVNNPLLQWVRQEVEIYEKQARLNTAMSLPKFYGGYMSEKVAGAQFQGVTVGIAVPLWENKNTSKFVKAKAIAMQSIETDARLQFYNDMKAMHNKVTALQTNVSDYRSKLELFSNSVLLEKAFTRGEISLTEYLYEFSLYYESMYKLLEMEMNLNLALSDLYKYQ
jgi:outer membrane protein TolC